MIATIRRARKLEGAIRVPGDKSISHRSLMLAAIATGRSRISGLSTGADVRSTAACLGRLGAELDDAGMTGRGLRGLHQAAGPLYCGNSGTTMRLLAGLLAGQEFESELTGDESLTRRPMGRVVEPLREMGARASWPPLRVGGETSLRGIDYLMPLASAQVKSAILLAGLYAGEPTTITEPVRTRDHTERMLIAMGATVEVDGLRVRVEPATALSPLDVEIPGDVSAGAFWLVAGGLVAGSRVALEGIGVNPTRTSFIDLLRRCGFSISVSNQRTAAGEAVANLHAHGAADPRAMQVTGAMAAEIIDELPVLAVAATQLPGRSVIAGAAELRVKESDRIAAMEEGLAAMGADISATDDGWVINGPRALEGARVSAHGDHRVAMALAVAGLVADGKTEIEGAEFVEISYPRFFDHLEYLC